MKRVAIPKRVSMRLSRQVCRFQRIAAGARSRGAGELETAEIVIEALVSLFGFDRRLEIAAVGPESRRSNRLLIRVSDSAQMAVEVVVMGGAISCHRAERAIRDAVIREIPWVLLTDGCEWQLHRVVGERLRQGMRVGENALCSWNLFELSPWSVEDHDRLFILCREGFERGALERYRRHVEAVNRYSVGAVLQSDPVLRLIRRELRRLSPDAETSVGEVRSVLNQVLVDDILDGDLANAARRRVATAAAGAEVEAEEVEAEVGVAVTAAPPSLGPDLGVPRRRRPRWNESTTATLRPIA